MIAPLQSLATCGGGALSSLSLPTVAFVRSYRAAFNAPTRIAIDSSDNVYVTDPVKGEVVVRAPTGRIIARTEGLGYPVSIAVDGVGRIYVGDGASGSVTAFGYGWEELFAFGQGSGEFLLPNDIAVDSASGEVYVADSKAHLVKVYNAAGALLRSFGGQGSADGQLSFPTGIFVDATAREVLVVDQLNFRVQVFDLSGSFLSCFGTQGSGAGKFNVPQGIWQDGQGRIYVTDSFEGRIQVLDRNGNFVGFIGEFGESPGQLRLPMDMVIDSSNRFLVTSANNARVEMFGLDAFADPETIAPADIDIQPDPFDRASPEPVFIGYIEVPGYSLDQVVLSTVTANGVAANPSPISIGDRNGNGTPDLRLEFDRAALIRTLPQEGRGSITVTGAIGQMQFEGTDRIEVTTTSVCGTVPPPVCSLGGADPQCNDALCIEPIGCTVQPKANGTSCDDGNACTVAEACSSGICTGGTPPACDDANSCTDDWCDSASGCAHADNSASCDDGSACTSGDRCQDGSCAGGPPPNCDDGNACTDDSCDAATGCVHADNTGPCDDGDPGTVEDRCDGAGECVGLTLTHNYAVLGWPPVPPAGVLLQLDSRARVHGSVCTNRIQAGPFTLINGNAVATESVDDAITFRYANRVGGNVVTGGGSISGLTRVSVGGRVDTSGVAAELGECFAASYRASMRWVDFAALATSLGLDLGSIQVERWVDQRIPPAGTFGSGRIVVDATGIQLDPFATLTLAGAPATEQVIIRVHDSVAGMTIGYAARIETEGLVPEQILFLVDGPVTVRPYAQLAGSVFATQNIRIERASRVAGAILGSGDIQLDPFVSLGSHPFAGW